MRYFACLLLCLFSVQLSASPEDDYKEIRDHAPDYQEDKESGMYDKVAAYYLEIRDLPLSIQDEKDEKN